MKGEAIYTIDLVRQPLGGSEHQFEVNSAFFDLYDYSPVKKGNLVANVHLEKSSSLLVIKVKMSGSVELVCDRTEELYMEPMTVEDRVVFQLGEHYVEHSEHLIEIPAGTATLELAELFYNLIVVNLPMKRLHPSLRDSSLPADAEGNLLVYSTGGDEEQESDETPAADNPFSILLQLKNNN